MSTNSGTNLMLCVNVENLSVVHEDNKEVAMGYVYIVLYSQQDRAAPCERTLTSSGGRVVEFYSIVCLQLELLSSVPSTPPFVTDEEGHVVESRGPEPIHFVFEDIHWTAEVSQQEAQRHLEVTFYPFKKVCYH